MKLIGVAFRGRKYRTSQFRSDYVGIVRRHGVSPELVYLLAHGRRPRSEGDRQILKELSDCHIIHG